MNSSGRTHFSLALASFIFLGAFAALADPNVAKLRILTENWPPISYEENGKAQGMAVELVETIQKDLGSQNAIEVVPWARGYKLLQDSPNTMLFTLIRNPEREKKFTLLGPVARGDSSLFVLQKIPQRFTHINEIKQKALVAATRGTAFESILVEQGFHNIVDISNTEMGVRLLLSGRIDVLCDDSLIIYDILKKLQVPANQIKSVAVLQEYNLYLGFSPGTEVQSIGLWKKSLEKIKRNGRYASIYRKWFNDMKPPKQVELIGAVPDDLKNIEKSWKKRLVVEHRKDASRD